MSYVLNFLKKLFNFIMGIVQKSLKSDIEKQNKQLFNNPVELTAKEIQFLLDKMKTATYKGEEFEMFYNVWVKLSNKLEKNK